MTEILELLFLIVLMLAAVCVLAYSILMFVSAISEVRNNKISILHTERPERPRDRAKDWLDNKRGGVK